MIRGPGYAGGDVPTDLPIEHVMRSKPPWRLEDEKTECGKESSKYPTISRQQMMAKFRKQGQQRASFTTCMTCLETVRRREDWETHPSAVIARQSTGYYRQGAEKALIDIELRALAKLYENHAAEFHAILESLLNDDLAERRAKRAR